MTNFEIQELTILINIFNDIGEEDKVSITKKQFKDHLERNLDILELYQLDKDSFNKVLFLTLSF